MAMQMMYYLSQENFRTPIFQIKQHCCQMKFRDKENLSSADKKIFI